MAQPFIGEIRLFGFNFPPVNYAYCNGQTVAISQNPALFSILGTTYGGNGTSTFALPNLQSRVPISFGQGPGLSDYVLGEEAGTESVTVLSTELPQHNHALAASSSLATAETPSSDVTLARSSGGLLAYGGLGSTATGPLTGLSGGSLPHNNIMPYLTINFCIALNGAFPARN